MSGLSRAPWDFDASWCAVCWGQRKIVEACEALGGLVLVVCPCCLGSGVDPVVRHREADEPDAVA